MFAFLPLALTGFLYLGRRSPLGSALWLGLASLFFYGWWDVRYVPLIVFSMTLNFLMARWLSERQPDWKG